MQIKNNGQANMSRKVLGVGLVILAVGFRFLPHPSNFTPLLAIFIFSSGFFRNKWWAVLFPLSVMFISDLLVNNIMYRAYFDGFVLLYHGAVWTYIAMTALSLLSIPLLEKFTFTRTLWSGVVASVLFYVISNFGVWFSGALYPKTVQGLITCYTMALPFFKNTLISTLLFVSAMYGITYYVEKKKWIWDTEN